MRYAIMSRRKEPAPTSLCEPVELFQIVVRLRIKLRLASRQALSLFRRQTLFPSIHIPSRRTIELTFV